MNAIATYAATKAVKLHQANRLTRGAKPGENGWISSRDLYRLTNHRIRGLMSPYASVHASPGMKQMRELSRPMLAVYENDGFKFLGGTAHWCA